MSKLTIWLTPIWLLSVGVAIGVALLLAAWAVCWVVRRPLAQAIAATVRDSILAPVGYLALALTAFALAGLPAMPAQKMWQSLQRIPAVRPVTAVATVPARTDDFPIEAGFRASELQEYFLESEQDVAVNVEPGKGFVEPLIQVLGGERYQWSPGSPLELKFEGDVARLYVTNESDAPTEVRIDFRTDVEMPEVHDIPVAAAGLVLVVTAYLLIRWWLPQTSVIAAATSKETVAQPIFLLLMLVGAVALASYIYIPYNTFGEDVKMLKTSGITTIKVLAIIVALWSASTSIADEIEGRTALTVLSKPVGRRQFILGKFFGIVWPVVLMFLVLGFVFLVTVSYKVVYDAREAAKTTPVWQDCYVEVVRIVPGLALALMEAVIMAAVSVAASTRLQMIPNLVVCGSIYVLGHLVALLVKSSVGEMALVRFVGRLISVFLPVLDHFEIEGAIAGAAAAPASYLLWTLLYTTLYCAVALMLALIFFEDRDLA